MKNLYSTLSCLVAVFIINLLLVQNGMASYFRILQRTDDRIVVEWTSPDLSWQNIQLDAQEYVIPHIADLPLVHNSGKPILPVDAQLFAISPAKVVVNILDSVVVAVHTAPICPAPSYLETESETGPKPYYVKDENIYQSAAFYPSRILTQSIGTSRDRHILRIAVHPVRYNPVAQTVLHLRYLRAEIVLRATSQGQMPLRRKSQLDRSMDKWLQQNKDIRSGKVEAGRGSAETAIEKTDASSAARLSSQPFPATASSDWYDPDLPYVKILTVNEGLYRVRARDLNALGVDIPGIEPGSLRLLYRGEEKACTVSGDQDGEFNADDQIVFFAERLAGDSTFYNAYTDTNVYWLTWNGEEGKRIGTRQSISTDKSPVHVFRETLHLERDLDYYHGDSDDDIHETTDVPGEGWVWVKFILPGSIVRVPFDLPRLAPVEDSVNVRLRLRGTTLAPQSPDHHARIVINGTVVADAYFNDREEKLVTTTVPATVFREANNQLEIHSIDDTGADRSQFYFDWVEFEYTRTMQAVDGWIRMKLPDTGKSEKYFVNGFSSDSIAVWDVQQEKRIQPLSLGKHRIASVSIQAAGYMDGNYAIFRIDGEPIFLGKRGINVVAVDSSSGAILGKKIFDTYASAEQADSLALFVNALPAGTIVLAGIRDEGVANITEAAYQALESIGSARIRQVNLRDSWAIIGRKGAPAGTVPEAHSSSGSGPVHVEAELFFPDGGDSWGVIFADTAKDFVVFAPQAWKQPPRLVKDKPTFLTRTNNGADYIIITHPAFMEQARRLADYRQSKNAFRTQVVLIQDIYDEFNAGIADPLAIKRFLKFAYHYWQRPAPSYLLLFGDATWDPKQNLPGAIKYDFVPTYGNPVSDLLFACFDGPDDILPEMSVGRLPAENAAQARAMVDKIIEYEATPSAEWKKDFLFISGGFNRYEQRAFSEQSKRLARDFVAPPPASGQFFFLNKSGQGLEEGEHRQDILDILDKGVLWVNFIGHAGSRTWDLMFHNPDIDELNNAPRYPFISSMTCHTGRFAEPDQTSFGENFVINKEKGAIAFWGTAGWGYSHEDYLFLRKLYPIALQDTVQIIGDAITLAKIALWGDFGINPHIRDLVLQYNLLGDPALDLALPDVPDLTMKASDIRVQPMVPSQADSIARVSITVRNYGLATRDSVDLAISAASRKRDVTAIGSGIVLPPIGVADSVVVDWPLKGWAGAVDLQAVVDPRNAIYEADESNNSQSVQVTVLSNRIDIVSPWRDAVVPANTVVLKMQNPQSQDAQQFQVEFQVDTTNSFDSPFLLTSGPVSADVLTTEWDAGQLPPAKVYFWRSRLLDHASEAAWVKGSFYVSPQNEIGWRQAKEEQFAGNKNRDTAAGFNGLTLEAKKRIFYVESAGYADGDFARIIIDNQPRIQPSRGHNLVVVDGASGRIIATRTFDTYRDSSAANTMARFIDDVPDDFYVLAAIKDEGSVSMTENAYRALESIGSALCREVGPRDSWAIAGRKGAAPGSVPERLVRSGNGTAVVQDTVSYYAPAGVSVTPDIGPATEWKKLSWRAETPETGNVSVRLLGRNRYTGTVDTLLSFEEETAVSLSQISADQYPVLQLLAGLATTNGYQTPRLEWWQITFDPAPDLAIGPQAFTMSADTVLVGEEVQLSFRLYNIGPAPVDSVSIVYKESDPVEGVKPFASQTIRTTIAEDSFVVVKQAWPSQGKTGLRQLFITVDPDDKVTELSETNNNLSASVYVQSDSASPEILVTFDGREIIYNDLVSRQPLILARITDNSPTPVSDTSAVNVFLDGVRIPFASSEASAQLVIAEKSKGQTTIRFSPVLSDGPHTLEILAADPSGNRVYHRSDFRVISKLRLLRVMNYPNPMSHQTDFTFLLTQPAEVEVKIYTVAGRLIRAFHQGWASAGFNTIRWYGRDEEGDDIANGVYIYKIRASNDSEQTEAVSKLMIMR